MRASSFAFFLLGLLVLYTVSAPVSESGGVTGLLGDSGDVVKSVLPGEHDGDRLVQARDVGAAEEQALEKRRGRGGSRPRRKRPARKKKAARKKKT